MFIQPQTRMCVLGVHVVTLSYIIRSSVAAGVPIYVYFKLGRVAWFSHGI